MLFDCKHCGAPLDVERDTQLTTCSYCSRAQRIEQPKRDTPSGWKPPREWTPPQEAHASSSVVLKRQPRRGTRKLILIAVVVTVVGVSGLVGALLLQEQAAPSGRSGRGDDAPAPWNGKTPLQCNGRMSIEGRKLTAKSSPAIRVLSSCNLTIKDSTITAKQLLGVEAFSGTVRIVDSKLTLTKSLGTSVLSVQVERSEIRFDSIAQPLVVFETSGNNDISVKNSTVAAKLAAGGSVVFGRCHGNGCVSFRDATLVVTGAAGAVTIFETNGNGTGSLSGGAVRAGGRPLGFDTVRAAHVEGTKLNGSKPVSKRRPPTID